MNVNDFQVPVPEGDMLETIFARQRQLMDKYHGIEEINVGHPIPSSPCEYGPHCGALNIQDRSAQLRYKCFAWYITEEITEATLASGESDRTHFLEELIDALHFSVELLILCGIHPQSLVNPKSPGDCLEVLFSRAKSKDLGLFMEKTAYEVIENLGEACNRMKLKSWKTTGVLTDEKLLNESLKEFFLSFIDLLKSAGFTARSATSMYLSKAAVNTFRQNSAY